MRVLQLIIFIFSVILQTNGQLISRLQPMWDTQIDFLRDHTMMRLKDGNAYVSEMPDTSSAYALITPRISSVFEELLPKNILSKSDLFIVVEPTMFVFSDNKWHLKVNTIRIFYTEKGSDGQIKSIRYRDKTILNKIRERLALAEVKLYDPIPRAVPIIYVSCFGYLQGDYFKKPWGHLSE